MIDLNDVKQVVTQTDGRTLTVYLNVDNAAPENQAQTPAWRIWMKNTLRNMGAGLGGDEASAWATIQNWVSAFLENYEPRTKGLAIFAGVSFQNAYELPVAFDNQVTFGRPHVAPLLWAVDEYEPYLVALVDQEKARLFISYLGGVGFQDSMEIDLEGYDFAERTRMPSPVPGVGSAAAHGGSGRDDFEDMIGEFRMRFYRDVAEQISKLMHRHNTRRVILGGAEESAHAVHHLMPDRLKETVVAVSSIPMRYNAQQIFDHVLPVAQEYERQQEMALVNQVIDFAKSRGRGALGRKGVSEALDMQRVELLIISWPAENDEMRALVEEMAFRALQLNSRIELVHGEAATRLNQEGGVAARLYYAL